MTAVERSNLVLAFARLLYVNGQATEQTVAAAEQLGRTLGLRAKVMPRWGELQLQSEDENGRLISQVTADPTGVDMDRVASAARAMGELGAGRLAPDAAAQAIAAISQAPPAPTWLFTLAAAAGAVALAVIFGVEHPVPAALIFVSAAAGAILRRGVARASANVFLQPFCAALVAGVIGALAVRYQLSSSLRLVAVCPCMVLVPGPHVLNGALDLINGRIHLGAARLTYAGLVIVAISTGLLLGLALLGVTLPVDEAGRIVPFWQDVIAAGVAVAAYSVFFSTPQNMLPWPVAVGMLSHALRWGAITVLLWRRDRHPARVSHRRADPHAGRTASAHAVCGHRICLRGVDDAGRAPVPDGQRPYADRGRRADLAGTDQRDDRRRHERPDQHLGDEPRPHHPEARHR